MTEAPLSDLCGKHRTEPAPPDPNRLVANIDAAFEQQIFDLPQRKRITMYIITARRITSGELLK